MMRMNVLKLHDMLNERRKKYSITTHGWNAILLKKDTKDILSKELIESVKDEGDGVWMYCELMNSTPHTNGYLVQAKHEKLIKACLDSKYAFDKDDVENAAKAIKGKLIYRHDDILKTTSFGTIKESLVWKPKEFPESEFLSFIAFFPNRCIKSLYKKGMKKDDLIKMSFEFEFSVSSCAKCGHTYTVESFTKACSHNAYEIIKIARLTDVIIITWLERHKRIVKEVFDDLSEEDQKIYENNYGL